MTTIGTPLTTGAIRVLMLGSGELGKEVVIELQRYGVEVIAVDRYASAPAMQVAHRSHVIDMTDAKALRRVIEAEKPTYVVPEIEAIATPELVVLELLARTPMYGYELVQAITNESGGTLTFGEGCIYPLLHKLEARGDLASRRLQVGGRSRVVYRVTPKGTKRRDAFLAQWSETIAAVGRVLQGGKHVQPQTRSA